MSLTLPYNTRFLPPLPFYTKFKKFIYGQKTSKHLTVYESILLGPRLLYALSFACVPTEDAV